MKKINGFLRLIRFELPFSAGICVVMGQLLALGEFASIFQIAAGFISVFAISASILVLNDYFDVETDKINAPDRPIASNLVTPSEALIFSIFLLFVGLLLSYFLNTATLISSIILLIIGFLYNWKFKKSGLPGNLMVSFSVGMTFVYGGVSVGLPFNKMVWFFGIISALIDLAEEIAADAMDMEGDKIINSNSLAINYGRDAALNISGFIFLLVILLTAIPFILEWFTLNYLIPIIIINFSIAFSVLKLLNSEGDEGRKYIRRIYLGATLGLMVFILMRYFNL